MKFGDKVWIYEDRGDVYVAYFVDNLVDGSVAISTERPNFGAGCVADIGWLVRTIKFCAAKFVNQVQVFSTEADARRAKEMNERLTKLESKTNG